MSAPTATISATELRNRLDSPTTPHVLLDVRTPAEFETAHIAGSYNVPLDVLGKHTSEVAEKLDGEIVLVCKSGQRATKAATLLHNSGLNTGLVLHNGFSDWERSGFAVERGKTRWELERQVRLVAELHRAVFRRRQRRGAEAQVGGCGHRRWVDIRRRHQHLRDGHGTVEAPVQPCSRWPRPDSEAGLRAASV